MKTVKEIITEVDGLKPNDYDEKDKIGWLQDVENRIQKEIIDTHENPDGIAVGKLEGDTPLVAAGPHTDIYICYLTAQIDRNNEEFDRYNNAMTLYNGAYESFERFWHNTHMPVDHGKFRL